jgi:cysteinyl-tRNA synthetase
LVEGEKMAKRLGNYFTVKDLTGRGHDPRAIRYLMLSTHYRQQLNFTFQGLEAAKNTLDRLENFTRRLLDADGSGGDQDLRLLADQFQRSFEEAMDDDLNINAALAALFDFVRAVNVYFDENKFSKQEAKRIHALIMKLDKVLGVISRTGASETLSKEAEELIHKREEARRARDWKEADKIRQRLKSMGIVIEDTPQGVKWHKEEH